MSTSHKTAAFSFLFAASLMAAPNPLLRDMKPDTWQKLPGTRLRDQCAPAAQFPGVQGTGGCRMVINAWSGGAYDQTGKRLWVWGGGHGDYHGNEIYSFSVDSLRWRRVTNPSPVTTLSADPMPDGSPVARHTYDGLAWLSHEQRLFAFGGSMAGNGYGTSVTWTFNPADKTWKNMLPIGAGNAPGTNCCNFTGEYDAVSRKVFMRDPAWLTAYDVATNTWSRIRSWSHTWGPGKTVVDTKRRLLITVGSNEFLVYDLANSKDVTAEWKTTGDDAAVRINGPGVAYDAVSDRIVAWAGGGVCALDMTTKVWTRMSSVGAPVKQQTNGTFGRFRWLPEENAFLLVNDVDDEVYAYKLGPGQGPTGMAKPDPAAGFSRPRVELAGSKVLFRKPGADVSRNAQGRTTVRD